MNLRCSTKLVWIGLLFGIGCTQPVVQTEAEFEERIQALEDNIVRVAALGNAEAMAQNYTPDAQFYSGGLLLCTGHEELAAYYQTLYAHGGVQMEIFSADRKALGEMAYDIGTYTLTLPTADETTTTQLTNGYMVVLKFVDGTWKMHRTSITTIGTQIQEE